MLIGNSNAPAAAVQSPVCLIADHVGPCNHKHCLMAYKKPQWYGISIADFYGNHEFTKFNIIRSEHGAHHLIPENPQDGKDPDFEIFRQSMNAIIHLAGEWPATLADVPREHVVFKWTEYTDTYPIINQETLQTEWRDRLDVCELAYYIGPEGTGRDILIVNEGFAKGGNPCV